MADQDQDNEVEHYKLQYSGDEKSHSYVTRDGEATALFVNKDRYKGEYKEHKRNGKGEYVFSTGAKYSGEYADNKRTGLGTLTYPNKSKYIGEWKENKKDGFGTYYYGNGDKYCGDWKNDQKNGNGSYLIQTSQTQVTGRWVNGVCEDGVWEYFDKSSFFAVFINNKVKSYFSNKQAADAFFEQQQKVIGEKNQQKLTSLLDRLDLHPPTAASLYRLVTIAHNLISQPISVDKFSDLFQMPIDKELSPEEFVENSLIISQRLTNSNFIETLKFAVIAKDWIKTPVDSKSAVDVADGTFPDYSSFDIFSAARLGSLISVKRLITANSQAVQVVDKSGKTALAYSSHNGHVRVTKYLLEQGAKWDSKMLASANHDAIKGLFQDFPQQKLVAKPPQKKEDDDD